MNIYSEHCTQHFFNNNKTQYKKANVSIVLQATMFDSAKFKVYVSWLFTSNTYLNNGYNS